MKNPCLNLVLKLNKTFKHAHKRKAMIILVQKSAITAPYRMQVGTMKAYKGYMWSSCLDHVNIAITAPSCMQVAAM